MSSPTAPSRALPMVIWAVLIACVVANTVASIADAPLVVYLVLGGLTAVCVAVLTALHLRTRR